MGKLVLLDKRRRPARRKATSASEGEVVIFTGIRYERDPDPMPTTPKAKGKRKQG